MRPEKSFTAPSGRITQDQVECPSGTRVLGGGFALSDTANIWVKSSTSNVPGYAWVVKVDNESGADTTVVVNAICAKVE
ncbi:MAG: hypothetical protein HY680_07470 [Chloroflexi bacterium]|nr:hypothetical protein [Chloroflexota bacterium]